MIKGNCAHIVYEFIFPQWITHTSGNIINAIHFLRVSKQKRNIFDNVCIKHLVSKQKHDV